MTDTIPSPAPDDADEAPTTAADLLAHVVTEAMAAGVEKLTNRCMYTTTMLEALAQFHEANEDTAGAALLRTFTQAFAEHEASTL